MSATRIPAATVIVEMDDVSIDQLCFAQAVSALGSRKAAGKVTGYVEATFAANPGLADSGTILPRGLVVRLPDFVLATEDNAIVRLWE